MSTFNISIKVDAVVDVSGGTTATLGVPSGKTFKGTASGLQFNGSLGVLTVRKTNVGGVRVLSHPMVSNGDTFLGSPTSALVVPLELGEGTYFLHIEGTPLNQSVAFQGTLYSNTL